MVICLPTHEFYVGKDKHNNPKYLGSGVIWENFLNKYGKTKEDREKNFRKVILDHYDSWSDLSEGEKVCIKELHALKSEGYGGVNISPGGNGAGDCLTNHPNKDQIRKRMRENHADVNGEKNPMFGKKFNHKKTEDHLRKIVVAQSKPIFQFSTDGELIKEWESAMQIERELGFSHSHVGRVCLNKKWRRTTHGFIWKFKNA